MNLTKNPSDKYVSKQITYQPDDPSNSSNNNEEKSNNNKKSQNRY